MKGPRIRKYRKYTPGEFEASEGFTARYIRCFLWQHWETKNLELCLKRERSLKVPLT